MEKKYQIIYIWSFIIVSCIILLLLYTPLGGDLHQTSSSNYGVVNTTVDFGGGIANSPKSKVNQYRLKDDIYINRSSDSRAYSQSNFASSGPSVGENTPANYAVGLKSNKGLQSTKGSGAGGGNSVFSKSSASSGEVKAGGGVVVSPFSSSTPSSSSGTVIQKATNDVTNLSDPGGEDPTGDPLPVGDGMYIMIILVAVYVLRIFLKKQ